MLTGETKKQTRERNVVTILQAAEKVFAEAGYKGASISMIASEAGVTRSSISYYFQSKEALYKRVVDDILKLWLGASKGMDDGSDPRAALEQYIHDKMDLSRRRPYGSKVWANEIIHGAPFITDFIEGELKAWMRSREAILTDWMDRGLVRRIDPKHILYMIWATTQHYADFQHQVEALNGNKPLSDAQWKDVKETVAEIILSGVGLSKTAG